MDSLLRIIDILGNNNSANLTLTIFSLVFGFFSVLFGGISIYLAFYFFKLAKESEQKSSNLLTKISYQTNILEKVSDNLINKLMDYATKGKDIFMTDILKLQYDTFKLHTLQIKNIDIDKSETEKILYDLYIRYYYFLYQLNFYAMISDTRNKDIIMRVINILTVSHAEFIRVDKILLKYDYEKIKQLPNYELYIFVDKIKDNVIDGNTFLKRTGPSNIGD